jgi:ubiquinone/menaquinone biosynthesis C-methylase UbiE
MNVPSPFNWAAMRALSLCGCPEASNLALPYVEPGLKQSSVQSEAALQRVALKLLEVQDDDQVLEIGCGTGEMLGLLLAQTPRGHVVGIARSLAQVTEIARRHQFSIKAGRLEMEHAEPDALPFEFARFSKILAVSDYAEWSNQEWALTELKRVLRAGGTLVLGLALKATKHSNGSSLAEAEEVAGLVRWVGFERVRLVCEADAQPYACVVATH